ncbi:hypothetical protein PSHT_01049 [Puccinia striiformis]|uniref:Uncharacterized protein n=1 Tax=Puccinia striiformis TaxID=27350 RepID=A0A2S4WLT9_9BASI|nr:hypothetical protein PSHT_01049 [Puccinia striiformis]
MSITHFDIQPPTDITKETIKNFGEKICDQLSPRISGLIINFSLPNSFPTTVPSFYLDRNPLGCSEILSQASSVFRQTGSSQLFPADKRKRSQKRPPSKPTSVKQKSKTHKHNKRTPAASNDESHLIKVDIVQDSGKENSKAKVVTTLQDLSSKFTLIHDVWTTKGNRHAFMEISVAYITADWKASCPPGLESSKSTLGFIPGLSTIDEESKEVEPNNTYVIEDVELGNNPMEANGFNNDNNPTEQLIQNQTGQSNNSINGILKKVDFIIQRITSSSAKQFEYTTWSKNLEINGPSLIAGYGIQWNIKFQSRERGYKGRMVIAKIFELEPERQKVEGGPNHYSNLNITSSDWEVEFYFLTKKMEGDYSSGSMILSEYHQVEDFLNTRLATAEEPELKAMLRKMLTKTDTYLQEALHATPSSLQRL